MWIFSEFGLFDVCKSQMIYEDGSDESRDFFQICAPSEIHLQQLILAFPRLSVDIENSEKANFPFQITVAKDLWVDAMMAMTQYVDYQDFKHHLSRCDDVLCNEIIDLLG